MDAHLALHGGQGHFSHAAVHVLHKAAALARRDLDVDDVPEAPELGLQLLLRGCSAQAADEEGGVVGVKLRGVGPPPS